MRPGVPAALALACALAACSGRDAGVPVADDRPAATGSVATDASTTGSARAPTPQPGPRTAPAADATPAASAPRLDARLDGFGALTLGMTLTAAGQAWPGVFDRLPRIAAGACFNANPAGIDLPYFSLMFEDGKFVRYDSANAELVAPGGGRRGMSEAQLQALYRDALQATPHRFVRGGKYLSLDASGVAPSRLVFETDAMGIVSEWRVGLRPQADYTEGCESAAG